MVNKSDENAPSPGTVSNFHKNADTDSSKTAIHHTLGGRSGQAASGSHTHNGNDSPLLLSGLSITGTDEATTLESVVRCLIRLGAKDDRGE